MKRVQSPARLLLLLLFPLLACAGEPPGDEVRLQSQWQALDKNGDGQVALAELNPFLMAAMQRSDLDADGYISLQEYVLFDRDPGGSGRMPLADNVRLVPDLPYAATDDPRQQLDIYLPRQPAVAGPLPVIAFVHGGGWKMGSRVMARPMIMPLVESGRYAAVSIGYRLSWQDIWPAQLHDVKAAIRWIRAHAGEYGLDPGRICAMGPSAGGHLVAELGTTNGDVALAGKLGEHTDQSSDVQCVIDFFGPADLTSDGAVAGEDEPSPVTRLLGGRATDLPQLAAEASPVHQAGAGDVPFLIVHGTADPLVNYSQSVALQRALREAGVPVILQTVEGAGHGTFGNAIDQVNARVAAFLEQQFYDPTVAVPSDTLRAAP